MKIEKPNELIGKQVCDAKGNTIGWVDKTWNSWNQESPGYFFGVKTNDEVRAVHFGGTTKLIPIYSNYISNVGEKITLNKTIDELNSYWHMMIPCGTDTCQTYDLFEKPVYDKEYSRVGTFCTWYETEGKHKHYGVFVDPYLCKYWNIPSDTVMPVPYEFITQVKDTVTLNKSLDELKNYWQQHQKQTPTQQYQYQQTTTTPTQNQYQQNTTTPTQNEYQPTQE
jgi:sporulation protein YlmC with PRC-barrel domain